MAYSKIKTYYLLAIISFVIIFTNSCKKNYIYNYQYVLSNTKKYIFMPGSKWIYKSDILNTYDTVICLSLNKDTLITDWVSIKGYNNRTLDEYYNMILKHSNNNSLETHYFSLVFDRVNGEINENKIYGQYYLDTDSNITTESFNGFIKLIDTNIIVNTINYNTIHNKIIATDQTHHVYDFDTDLFLVENIGLVKRFDQYEGWSLVSYHVYPVNY